MLWMLDEFGFSIADRVLQKTPYSFDASVWELFAPLMSGARLVMARAGGHQDVEYLIEEIKAREITVLQVVPSLLKALLDAGLEECQSLQRVCSGGEVLTREVKEEFARQVGVELINLYGPTEATIEVTYWRCEGAERKRSEPIGRPISNARVYVLGERMAAVGIGMRGELYIGGESVGRGYIGRPELTAERFVPDPYSRSRGARLYRTGDEVRYRGDGVLEYEGRRDGQVKVRGYRIELGEIEAALEQHPGVRQAVVVVSENNSGDRRLIGHVIARNDRAVKNAELMSFLRPRLPVYMLPSTLIVIDSLPLLPNGKVDRDALAAARLVDQESNGHAIAPRTLIEESLAGIWTQILGTNRSLTLQDNFFELGGHSLLATRLVSRVREVFEVDFPLGQLFDSPTVATMAEGIETLLRAGSKTLLPPIERVARDGELLLSFAQQRLWFMHHLDPDTTFYNLPTAVRIHGKLDRDALARSINEIVHRHEVLRTTFTQVNGTPTQIIIPRQEIEVTDIDLSRYPERQREAEAHRIAAEDSKQTFDLAQGPLLRATLIKLGEEDHVFVITLHHIVFDNWSTGILIRELCALYGSFSSNVPVDLPELPIQYADFAAWQRAHLQGELLERQLSYWRERLSGQLPVLKLPTDYSRPLNPSFQSLNQSVLLSEELSSSLRSLSNHEGVTLFITMLASFYCLLYRYTGQQDLVLGSPIVNRSRPEAEGLIGFFVNHLVLRVDLSGNPSFRQLLERVRTVTLGAYTHQDVPFENLVEEIQPERNFSHMPLFNVAFALQNAPSAELEIPGLKLSGFRSGQDMIVLDLLLIIIETKQGLVASLSGPKDLYEAETIREMLSHYKAVLEEVAARPDVNLLSVTLPSERPGDFPDATALLVDRFEIEQFNF
jgi:non-ribosomal peptide synthetase component F/acyl carrier protein